MVAKDRERIVNAIEVERLRQHAAWDDAEPDSSREHYLDGVLHGLYLADKIADPKGDKILPDERPAP